MSKKNTWMKAAAFAAVITEACSLGAGLACFEKNMTRRPEWPSRDYIPTSDDLRLDYVRDKNMEWLNVQRMEHEMITSYDGLRLEADYVYHSGQQNKSGRKIALLSHGYGGAGIRDMNTFTDFYMEEGYDLLFIDHRSHGKSEGEYITFGAKESLDLCAWARWIVNKWGEDCQIVLHGWSMGAASAYLAAARDLPIQVKCVICDCGFSSAYEEYMNIAKSDIMKGVPDFIINWVILHMNLCCNFISKHDIRMSAPLREAGNMKLPILFVHGKEDNFVPTWMSEKLYRATKNTSYKDILLVPKAGHVMSYVFGKKEYQKHIRKLFKASGLL